MSSLKMGTRSVPNYKSPKPLAITLRLSFYPSNAFGERIRKWRLEQGLLQTDLAKLLGVAEKTIVNWEKGRTKPVQDRLAIIKDILKIEP